MTTPPEVLAPCPFCGGEAEIQQQGTNRVSMIIGCTSCSCTLETGETWIDENSQWNNRANFNPPQGDRGIFEIQCDFSKTRKVEGEPFQCGVDQLHFSNRA